MSTNYSCAKLVLKLDSTINKSQHPSLSSTVFERSALHGKTNMDDKKIKVGFKNISWCTGKEMYLSSPIVLINAT